MVATGGRHKHPQRPQSHARRTLRCGFAQACAAARRARALGRSDDMMIDDHVWTRVIERMALCRTNCSLPQSREVRVDSPVSARRPRAMRPSYNASADAGRSSDVALDQHDRLHAISVDETREQTVTDGPAVALDCRFPRRFPVRPSTFPCMPQFGLCALRPRSVFYHSQSPHTQSRSSGSRHVRMDTMAHSRTS